jgi:hypothetical protein
MTLSERLTPDPRHLPDNVILPVQDSTSRIFGAHVPTGSDGAA